MTLTLIHDSNAVLDYRTDWSDWLAAAETITAHTVTPPTGVTVASTSVADGIVTAWISGGTVGQRYPIVFHITTSAGRQDDRTILLLVQNR